MSEEFELDVDDLTRRMDGAMTALKSEFASLRTVRRLQLIKWGR